MPAACVSGVCLLHLHEFQFLDLLFPDWNFPVIHVSLGMFGEVIAPHKLPRTYWTLILPLSCVGASMASKFIRTGKLSVTVFPFAQVWFFSRMSPDMGF